MCDSGDSGDKNVEEMHVFSRESSIHANNENTMFNADVAHLAVNMEKTNMVKKFP